MEGAKHLLVERTYQRKYEYMFDKFSEGIIVVDPAGIVQEINLCACDLFEINREELIGKQYYHLLSHIQIDADLLNGLRNQLSTGKYAQIPCPITTASKVVKFFNVSIYIMEEQEGYFIRVEDKTEQLSLRERLAQSESLNNLGQLAASIAHEIRNPMTSLKGFTQLMSLEASERGLKYIGIIEQEIERIDKILNEFLDLSKPKKLEIKKYDAFKLVSEVIDFMQPQALLAGINIHTFYKTPITHFETDCILTKQLLINSIKNAIEAMEDGGTICVQVEQKDNEVIISIHDEGPGLDLDEIQKYFQAFYTTKKCGTGLGLAHASQVMKDMNGRIEVANNLSGGASFYYYFPLIHRNSF